MNLVSGVNRFLVLDFQSLSATDLGRVISDARRALGHRRGKRVTQRELAEAVGVHELTVTAWETGKQKPDADNLAKVTSFLGMDSDETLMVREARADYGVSIGDLNLPDVSFLAPRARALFDEAIGNWVRRRWTSEIIENAATLLLGYFNRTSTLQSSGASVPKLSEEMQVHILTESREEIEDAFAHLERGSPR